MDIFCKSILKITQPYTNFNVFEFNKINTLPFEPNSSSKYFEVNLHYIGLLKKLVKNLNEFIFQYDNIFKIPIGLFSDFIFQPNLKLSQNFKEIFFDEFNNYEINLNISLNEIKRTLISYLNSNDDFFLNKKLIFQIKLKLSEFNFDEPIKMLEIASLRLLFGILTFDSQKIINSMFYIIENINNINYFKESELEIEKSGNFSSLYFFENKYYFLIEKIGLKSKNKIINIQVENDSLLYVDDSIYIIFTSSINTIQSYDRIYKKITNNFKTSFKRLNRSSMKNLNKEDLLLELPDYIEGKLDEEEKVSQISFLINSDSEFRSEYEDLKDAISFSRNNEYSEPHDFYFNTLS